MKSSVIGSTFQLYSLHLCQVVTVLRFPIYSLVPVFLLEAFPMIVHHDEEDFCTLSESLLF